MFKSYILVALRNIRKQQVFSLINLIGMAIGMAGFALFAHIAGVKLNADRFHANADNLYSVVQVSRVQEQQDVHTTFVPSPLAIALLDEFPELTRAARALPAGKRTLKRGEDSFYERNILFVDPDFLSMFSFKLSSGDPGSALDLPQAIVMSESAAEKYFGDDDPIGRILTFEKDIDLTVTGVSKDIPRTSSLRFEFLISMDTARALYPDFDSWQAARHTVFVMVGPEFQKDRLEDGLPDFIAKYYGAVPDAPQSLYLFPFLDFRLKSRHITSFIASSHPAGVIVVFALGVLLLVVVCINFINLSTARYLHRAREVGVRKVIGARRFQLITQFLGESLVLAFLAFPAAVIFYELIHPVFAEYMGSVAALGFTSSVSNSIWNYPFLLKYLTAAAVLTGLISGIYPALFLSAFQPVRVLKGNPFSGAKRKRGSKILIVSQFSFAVIFVACAGIIRHQSGHLLKADLGYTRDRIAVVDVSGEARSRLEVLKTKISTHADVRQITASAGLPVIWSAPQPARPVEAPEEESFVFEAYGVDFGFMDTLGMTLTRGRDFDRRQGDTHNFILNEAAVKKLNWDNPLGEQLTVGGRKGVVIGVARDFLFADIGFNIPPAVLYLAPDHLNYILVKFSSPEKFSDLHSFIKEQWRSVCPDLPFACMTLDDYFNDFFMLVKRLSGFLNIIGFSAVLFSCLGLLGLSTYLVEQRTKEIGIRKVMGASSARILWKLIREYVFLVGIANFVALALVYFGWNRVLQTGLLFMTNIDVATYITAVTVSLGTAVLAVTVKTLEAVRANPAESLRNE